MGWGQNWGAGQYGLDELRQRFNLLYSPELEKQAKARDRNMYNTAGDIWGINQAGERVYLGKASGLYGNKELIEAHARQASPDEIKHSLDNSDLSSIGDRAGAIWNLWSGQGTNLPETTGPEPPAAPSPDENAGNYDYSDALGMTPAEFDLEADLARMREQGNINTTIENIIRQSNNYIADVTSGATIKVGELSAGATKYASDRSLEASNYASDRSKEAILGAENIRKDTALQLQPIINAGLKDVETIRGASAKDVARITGEFGVKGEEVRGKSARDVAKIDKDKAIYGSLISAFSFT
jgi:hypothetical protein